MDRLIWYQLLQQSILSQKLAIPEASPSTAEQKPKMELGPSLEEADQMLNDYQRSLKHSEILDRANEVIEERQRVNNGLNFRRRKTNAWASKIRNANKRAEAMSQRSTNPANEIEESSDEFRLRGWGWTDIFKLAKSVISAKLESALVFEDTYGVTPEIALAIGGELLGTQTRALEIPDQAVLLRFVEVYGWYRSVDAGTILLSRVSPPKVDAVNPRLLTGDLYNEVSGGLNLWEDLKIAASTITAVTKSAISVARGNSQRVKGLNGAALAFIQKLIHQQQYVHQTLTVQDNSTQSLPLYGSISHEQRTYRSVLAEIDVKARRKRQVRGARREPAVEEGQQVTSLV